MPEQERYRALTSERFHETLETGVDMGELTLENKGDDERCGFADERRGNRRTGEVDDCRGVDVRPADIC